MSSRWDSWSVIRFSRETPAPTLRKVASGSLLQSRQPQSNVQTGTGEIAGARRARPGAVRRRQASPYAPRKGRSRFPVFPSAPGILVADVRERTGRSGALRTCDSALVPNCQDAGDMPTLEWRESRHRRELCWRTLDLTLPSIIPSVIFLSRRALAYQGKGRFNSDSGK